MTYLDLIDQLTPNLKGDPAEAAYSAARQLGALSYCELSGSPFIAVGDFLEAAGRLNGAPTDLSALRSELWHSGAMGDGDFDSNLGADCDDAGRRAGIR